jgi:phosphoglycolate phosphatase
MHVLLWDIDGTLLTTSRAGVFALEEATRGVTGLEIELQRIATAGLTDAEIARAILTDAGLDPTEDAIRGFLREYERHLPDRLHWRQGRVLEGVRELLESLHGRADVLNLLLTGNTRAGAAAKLAHYGLAGFFRNGAFADDAFDRAGIARRALALARELTRVEPEKLKTVVIGDTPHDVACGNAIGARTLAVAGTHSAEALRACGAWFVVDRLPAPEEFARLVGLK